MKHTAIANTGNALADRLRARMVPEVILNPEHIGLCSPQDKGDMALGICLYDIRKCEEIRSHTMLMAGPGRQKYPSSFINLYYMITAYSGGDLKYRSEEEHKILGKVIQVFCDYGVLEELVQGTGLPEGETMPTIELLDLSLEDKMRIWNVPDMAYKASLFYRVGPVEIESQKTRDVQRVVDVDFTVEHQDGRK